MTKTTLFFILMALGIAYIYSADDNDQAFFAAISKSHNPTGANAGQPVHPIRPDLTTQEAANNRANASTNTMATNDIMTANAKVENLNQLLATNDLNEFTEAQVNEVESACQNRKHPLSELSCQVVQHHIVLVKQEDDANNPLESDWKTIEQNGGGVEFDEVTKETALSEGQHITGESGGVVDVLEMSLQNLADRALQDHSAEVRRQAIEEAILMKSEAVAPLLQDALNDDHPANSRLAAEGLRQLRESSMIPSKESDARIPVAALSNLAHTSLADQSAGHR
jgi:HEAT repeat protein